MARKKELSISEKNALTEAQNRARSVTVGNAFGGTTEIGMRRPDGTYTFCLLQPVEAIELLQQLAANVGCQVALQPRDDFSSWRDWRVSPAEKKHLNGHPPFANDLSLFQGVGTPNFDENLAKEIADHVAHQQEYKYVNGGAVDTTFKGEAEHVMATKKTIDE